MRTRCDFIKLALILIAVSFLNQKWRDKVAEDVIKDVGKEFKRRDND